MNHGSLWTRLAPPVLWNLGLSTVFLVTWFAPYAFGERTVHKLTFLMVVEFLVVHSTGFFAAIAGPAMTGWADKKAQDAERAEALTRGLLFGGLMGFYCLFAAVFSIPYGNPWPFLAFLIAALPKFPAVVLHPHDEHGQLLGILLWVGMTLLYLGAGIGTAVAPVPALGITPEVAATQNFQLQGLWPEEPHRAIAFGTIYFAGLAVVCAALEWHAFRHESWLTAKSNRRR